VFKAIVRQLAFGWLDQHGYDMWYRLEPWERESRKRFWDAEREARQRYEALDDRLKLELPAQLEARYAARPIMGRVHVYDAIAELATVIDPLDPGLGCVSQLTHQLQLATAIEADGHDEKFVLCALLHDIGKLLLKFTDEDPINVEAGGKKRPLAGKPGGGLANCVFRWDHGDFAYLRLKDYVPAEIAWVLRLHSIDLEACEPYMDDQDRGYVRSVYNVFVTYDERKNMYAIPGKRLEDYRPLIERAFPRPIAL
jgi:hypothetical protein